MARARKSTILEGLNPQQRQAVVHGDSPLLIIAGAGTGKTKTLVHRVAHLIERGIDPARLLLLTFTRRSAADMLRRVDILLAALDADSASPEPRAPARRVWGGTFHATAARLLRLYGKAIGLDPTFTIHDRGDSEDLIDVLRGELGFAEKNERFPKKGTCLAIYSHGVNSQDSLEEILRRHHRAQLNHGEQLKQLFQAYTDRKEQAVVLDYDDLLLFWKGMLADEAVGPQIRGMFDAVLVDEYQDTNRLQADILRLLRPDGSGLTVVGDDAQSIYSFRAATIRNILDFPKQFPGTAIVKLEQNYRSTQSILDVTNAVIAGAKELHAKRLWSQRNATHKPLLISCEDEDEQAEYLVQKILAHHERGIALREQAVLFRAAHHSILLETELARHRIPFVKYGGLKFVESAHVKDVMAFLRLAENPRDIVAGMRVLKLLPRIGQAKAAQLMSQLQAAGGDLRAWKDCPLPKQAAASWSSLWKLLRRLTGVRPLRLSTQMRAVCKFYLPLMEAKYDHTDVRARDLEQLEQLADRFADRRTMLVEIALEPPTSTRELAGPPGQDDDYLVLSTVHSAKGLEWDVVYTIGAHDGNFPISWAGSSSQQIEEERRLFYVALTRARDWLYVCFPLRFYQGFRGGYGDPYQYSQLTRFVTGAVKKCLDNQVAAFVEPRQPKDDAPGRSSRRIRQQSRSRWS